MSAESAPSLRLATEARGQIKKRRQGASARRYTAPKEREDQWLDWYLRISKDAEQRGLGVKRQKEDGLTAADRLGIPRDRVRFHRDNDIGGGDFTERAAYDGLIEGIATGAITFIGATESSRLAREPLEKEELYLICETFGVRLFTLDGDDFTPGDDAFHERLAMSRSKGAWDTLERMKIRKRVRRKHLSLAMAGEVSGGGPRPFGFEDDRMTIRLAEAGLIREGIDRLLEGEALHSLGADWRARGVTTPGRWRVVRDDEGRAIDRYWEPGKAWQDTPLKRMLIRYRHAGWREHHGQPVAKAVWPEIVPREKIDALRLLLSDPARQTNAVRTGVYLFSGALGRCGECGAKLIAKPNNGKPGYRCPPVDRGGKGCVYITGKTLEDEVLARFFAALSDEAMLAAWRDATADDAEQQAALDAIEADETILDNLARALGLGLDPVRYGQQVAAVDERLAANRALLRAAKSPVAMVEAAGGVDRLMADWPAMSVGQRRAKLATAIDHFTVSPTAVRGSKKFDPARVRVFWVDGATERPAPTRRTQRGR